MSADREELLDVLEALSDEIPLDELSIADINALLVFFYRIRDRLTPPQGQCAGSIAPRLRIVRETAEQ